MFTECGLLRLKKLMRSSGYVSVAYRFRASLQGNQAESLRESPNVISGDSSSGVIHIDGIISYQYLEAFIMKTFKK